MMRIDLPVPLGPDEQTDVAIEYSYNIVDAINDSSSRWQRSFLNPIKTTSTKSHSGIRELRPTPILALGSTKRFLGRGEFTLELGDYRVRITVPSEMVVASTGTLQNPDDVLRGRMETTAWRRPGKPEKPVFVITPDEAKANESHRTKTTKTWEFAAKNVRDFRLCRKP